jgi:hypothetical protein
MMLAAPASQAASGGPAAPRIGKLLGCAAVCCISAAALGLSVHHGLQDTAANLGKNSVKAAAANDRQEECIYRAIRSKLPKGAPIYVPDYAHGNEVRANDLATLWAVPQPGPATARWIVSLVPGRECGGLRLEVRPR